MVDFGSAIKRPFGNIKTLVIAFVIGIFSFFLIPAFILTGFAAKTAQNALENRKELPTWSMSNAKDYLIKGIMIFVIYILYMLSGLVLLIVAVAIGLVLMDVLISGLLFLLGLLLVLIGAVLSPMAVMHYLKTRQFKSAFALGTVIKKTLSVKYLVSLVVMIAYGIILSIIQGILVLITFGLGAFFLIGIPLYLAQVTSFEVFADTYNELQ